jgi:hypothetical protein
MPNPTKLTTYLKHPRREFTRIIRGETIKNINQKETEKK